MVVVFRIRYDAPRAADLLAGEMFRVLSGWSEARPDFLCVGTDRSTGDSFGPMVGSFLSAWGLDAQVVRTLASPVHAQNVLFRVEAMRDWGVCPLVVVDADVGGEPGCLALVSGGLEVAGGRFGAIGDLGLSGSMVSGVGGHFFNVVALGTVRLWQVLGMARVAAQAVALAVEMLGRKAWGPLFPAAEPSVAELVAACGGGEA